MLGTIARSLTHPLGQSAQREMHAGQVTAAAVPLRALSGRTAAPGTYRVRQYQAPSCRTGSLTGTGTVQPVASRWRSTW
jgi:hypothetical protein